VRIAHACNFFAITHARPCPAPGIAFAGGMFAADRSMTSRRSPTHGITPSLLAPRLDAAFSERHPRFCSLKIT
jgi:hypothetical protein